MGKDQNIVFVGKTSGLAGLSRKTIREVAQKVATTHNFKIEKIRYILVTDEEILQINQQFLQHDYYTDIITFDLTETPGEIQAEIYISIDTVSTNAKKFHADFTEEMTRVIFHGLLHLVGFSDKSTKEQKQMRAMEEQCLNLYRESNRQE